MVDIGLSQFTVPVVGYNADVDTGTVPEDIVGNGGQAYLPSSATAAASVNIASSSTADTAAGTGARTIRIEGLTTDYVPFTEDVTLNGTTNVNPTNDIFRINRAYVLTAGSGGTNAGTITIADGSGTFTTILAGEGSSLYAVYTVPAGHVGYLNGVYASVPDTGVKVLASWELMSLPDGGVFQVRLKSTCANDDSSFLTFAPPFLVNEKTTLKMRVVSVGADNTPVSGGFSLTVKRKP